MKRNLIPSDSALHDWVTWMSLTEVPVSYQVLCGLAALGICMKRYVYIDQTAFRVYPNMSVLLVGPSGIGKDTAISPTIELVSKVSKIPILGGKTMDVVKAELVDLAPPATALIAAPEMTAFLGGKDYQKSMVQELTDLLSTGSKVDVSTKGDRRKYIIEPTISVLGGSTSDWLEKAMPEGSLEGGFLPRFVIICERFPAKHVAWVKHDGDITATKKAIAARDRYYSFLAEMIDKFATGRPRELIPDDGAKNFYRNWYANRFSYFSSVVAPYANRSRDHVHRLAMLMALSCRRSWLEESDYVFAANLIHIVAGGIDKIIAPMIGKRKK